MIRLVTLVIIFGLLHSPISTLAQNKCYKAQSTNSINHIKSWSMALDNVPGVHYLKHNYTTSSPKHLSTTYANPSIRAATIVYGSSPNSTAKRVALNSSNTSQIGDSSDYLICITPYNLFWDTAYCATTTSTPNAWQSATASFGSEHRHNYSNLSGSDLDLYPYALSIPSYGFYLNDNSDLAQAHNYPNGVNTINQYALRPALLSYRDINQTNAMARSRNSYFFQMELFQDYIIDFGLYDEDGDSIAVELIDLPAIHLSSGLDYDTNSLWIDSLSSMPYKTGFTAQNPFPNNGFSLDPVSHQISVKPNAEGVFNFGIRVKEYRKGSLVAYADKIAGVLVHNTVKKQPYISPPFNVSSTATQIGNTGKLYACNNANVQFDVALKNFNTLYGISNFDVDFAGFGSSPPSYSIVYTNNLDSAVLRFIYSGSNPDQIWKYINIHQVDTSCLPEKGMLSESSQTISLWIFDALAHQVNDQAICAGDTISLSMGSSYYYTVPVQGDYSSLSCYQCPNPKAYPDKTTTYVTYPFMGTQMCNISDTFVIRVAPRFDIEIDGPDIACTSALKVPLKTNLTPQINGLKYSWSPLAHCNPNNTPNTELNVHTDSTWVRVQAWDTAGCHSSEDSILVVNSPNFNPGANVAPQQICLGDTVQANAWGGSEYMWSASNGHIDCDTCAETFIVPLSTSVISVSIKDSLGCNWAEEYKVIVLPIPVADAGKDTTIYDGAVFGLDGHNSMSYSASYWTPSEYLYDPLSIETEGLYLPQDTVFVLHLSNGVCRASDSVLVKVIPCVLFPIPNVFEPEGHRWVNRFKPNMRDPDTYVKMRIYNRWGNLVYEENSVARDMRGWDGRIKGEMQPLANYVWVIEVDCTRLDGQPGHAELTGTVLLIK